ncbi:glutathione S-transferase family protein [Endothiovibrio diazotrophicus]
MELELVTFKICPFGQRPLITLRYKQVPHQVTYITPDTLPDWFATTSPLGKVPLLKVDGETVLFESAVINEFVDEISVGSLLPEAPVERAMARAWVEFASACLVDMHGLSTAADETAHGGAREGLLKKLAWLERHTGEGRYFLGEGFSLIDTAFGPLFQRLDLLQAAHPFIPWEEYPKVRRWADTLLAMEAISGAVPEDFEQRYKGFLKMQGGYGAKLFAA